MPGPDLENSSDRESHALAAGFALGMMMIGQGNLFETQFRVLFMIQIMMEFIYFR